VHAVEVALLALFATPESVTRTRAIVLWRSVATSTLVTCTFARMYIEFALVETVESTIVTRRSVPVSIAVNAVAPNLAPSTMAVVSADLTLLAGSPRIVTATLAFLLEERAVVLTRNIARLALMARETTHTFARTRCLVEHTAVEASSRALLALGSLGEGWALTLTTST
jgi:hypothetical protein